MFRIFLSISLISGIILLAGGTTLLTSNSDYTPRLQKKNHTIAIVGDNQRTSIWELLMGREQNDPERKLVIKSIADANPAMLILLGDMVFDGSSFFQWEFFDSLLAPVKTEGIPMYPILGNHEYWGRTNSSLSLLYKRFPALKQKTWYAQTYDSLALVFLNSNQVEMSSNDWQEQIDWYNNRIYSFDNDPSIKGILVFVHHPPFTNSTVTGDEENVQEAFLPAYIHSSKTAALLSGHVHSFERFIIDGKMFIVAGGGGGPRVNLNRGADAHKDLCKAEIPRPFNYLLVERTGNGLNIKVKALKKNEKQFYILEDFTIPLNKLSK